MIESQHDELFGEPKRSTAPMLLAGLAAFLITGVIFAGYTLLRKRHAEDSGSLSTASQPTPAPKPKALVIVDEAMLKDGKTTIGGVVRNTSSEKLEGLSVELELKSRKDASTETRLVPLAPEALDPQQEGRYSLQLKASDYSSARLVGIKAGATLEALAYTTAAGQKRPPERLEPKTIIVGKSPSKGGEFLNSPDKPARVP
ncbi:MAG TPA: hypothetical protein VIW64_13985 [Pyrinomonadaceae bacterium]|jgi:hypothetical protein